MYRLSPRPLHTRAYKTYFETQFLQSNLILTGVAAYAAAYEAASRFDTLSSNLPADGSVSRFRAMSTAPGFLHLATYVSVLREVVVVNSADNFQAYVKDVLGIVFRGCPGLLKSEAAVTMADVVDAPSREALIAAQADRRADEMSNRTIKQLIDYLRSTFKLALQVDQMDVSNAARVMALRNILVHNRGIADKKYQLQSGDDATPVGKRVEFGDQEVLDWTGSLMDIANIVDHVLVTKYRKYIGADLPPKPGTA